MSSRTLDQLSAMSTSGNTSTTSGVLVDSFSKLQRENEKMRKKLRRIEASKSKGTRAKMAQQIEMNDQSLQFFTGRVDELEEYSKRLKIQRDDARLRVHEAQQELTQSRELVTQLGENRLALTERINTLEQDLKSTKYRLHTAVQSSETLRKEKENMVPRDAFDALQKELCAKADNVTNLQQDRERQNLKLSDTEQLLETTQKVVGDLEGEVESTRRTATEQLQELKAESRERELRLQQSLDSTNDSYAVLEKRYEEDISEAKDAYAGLETRARGEITELRAKLESAGNEFRELRDSSANAVQDLESRLQSITEELAQVQESAQAKQRELASKLDETVTTSRLQEHASNAEKEELSSKLSDAENNNASLVSSLNAREAELENTRSAFETRIDSMETSSSELEEALESTKQQLQHMSNLKGKMEDEVEEKGNELARVKLALCHCEERKETLTNQVADLNMEVSKYQEMFTSANETINDLTYQCKETNEELQARDRELTESRSKSASLETRISSLTDHLQETRNSQRKLTEQLSDLEDMLDLSKSEGECLREELKTTQAMCDRQELELSRIRNALPRVEALGPGSTVDRVVMVLDNLTADNLELGKKLAVSEQELDKQTESAHQLEDRVVALERKEEWYLSKMESASRLRDEALEFAGRIRALVEADRDKVRGSPGQDSKDVTTDHSAQKVTNETSRSCDVLGLSQDFQELSHSDSENNALLGWNLRADSLIARVELLRNAKDTSDEGLNEAILRSDLLEKRILETQIEWEFKMQQTLTNFHVILSRLQDSFDCDTYAGGDVLGLEGVEDNNDAVDQLLGVVGSIHERILCLRHEMNSERHRYGNDIGKLQEELATTLCSVSEMKSETARNLADRETLEADKLSLTNDLSSAQQAVRTTTSENERLQTTMANMKEEGTLALDSLRVQLDDKHKAFVALEVELEDSRREREFLQRQLLDIQKDLDEKQAQLTSLQKQLSNIEGENLRLQSKQDMLGVATEKVAVLEFESTSFRRQHELSENYLQECQTKLRVQSQRRQEVEMELENKGIESANYAKELKTSREINETLRRDLAATKTLLERAENSLRDVSTEEESLRRELKGRQQSRERLNDMFAAEREKNIEHGETVESLSAALEELKCSAESLETRAIDQAERLRAVINEKKHLEAEFARSETERECAVTSKESLGREVSNLRSLQAELESTLAGCREERDIAESRFAEEKKRADNYDAQLRNVQDAGEETERRLGVMETEFEQCKGRHIEIEGQLKEELNACKREVAGLLNEKEALVRARRQTTEEIEALNETLRDLQAEYEGLQGHYESEITRRDDTQSLMERQKVSLQEEKAVLEESIKAKDADLHDRRNRADGLSRDLSALKGEFTTLSQEHDKLSSQLQSSSDAVRELESRLGHATRYTNKVEEELERARREVERRMSGEEEVTRALESERSRAAAELDRCQRVKEEYESLLKAKTTAMEDWNSQFKQSEANLRDQLERSQAEVRRISDEKKTLSVALEERQTDLESADTSVAHLREECSEYERKGREVEQRSEKLAHEAENLRTQLSALQRDTSDSIARIQAELMRSNSERDEQKSQRDSAVDELSRAQKIVHGISSENQKLKDAMTDIQEKSRCSVDALQQQLDDKHKTLALLETEFESSRRARHLLQSQLVEAQKDLSETQVLSTSLQQQVSSIEGDNVRLRSKQDVLGVATERVAVLEFESNSLRRQHELSEKHLLESQTKLREESQRRQQLELELASKGIEAENLCTELKSSREINENLQRDLAATRTLLDQAEESLRDVYTAEESLRRELKDRQQSRERLVEIFAVENEKNTQHGQVLESLRAELEELKCSASSLKTRATEQTGHLQDMIAAKENVEADLALSDTERRLVSASEQSLRREMGNLSSLKAELESTIVGYREERDIANSQFGEEKKRADDYKIQLRNVQDARAETERRLVATETEFEQSMGRHNQIEDQLKEELNACKHELRNVQDTRAETERRLVATETEFERSKERHIEIEGQLKEELNACQREIARLLDEKEALVRERGETTEEFEALDQALRDLRAQHERLEGQYESEITRRDETFALMERQKASLAEEKGVVEESIRSKDAELHKRRDQTECLSKELSALKGEYTALSSEHDKLVSQLQGTSDKARELELSLERETKRSSALVEDLKRDDEHKGNIVRTRDAEIEDLRATVDNQSDELCTMKARYETLSGERDDLVSQLQCQFAVAKELEGRLEHSREKSSEVSEELEAEKLEKARVQNLMEAREAELDSLRTRVDGLCNEVSTIKGDHDKTSGERDNVILQLQSKSAVADELKCSLASEREKSKVATEELEREKVARRAVEKLIVARDADLDNQCLHVDSLLSELSTLRSGHNTLSRERDELVSQLRIMSEAVVELESRLECEVEKTSTARGELERARIETERGTNESNETLRKLASERSRAEVEMKQLREMKEEFERLFEHRSREVASLQSQCDESDKYFRDQVASSRNEMQVSREDQEKLSVELEQCKIELMSLNKCIGSLFDHIRDLRVEIEGDLLDENSAQAYIELSGLHGMKTLLREVSALRPRLLEVVANHSSLKEHCVDVEAQCESVTTEMQMLRDRYDAMEKQSSQLTEQLKNLTQTHQEEERNARQARDAQKVLTVKLEQCSNDRHALEEQLSELRSSQSAAIQSTNQKEEEIERLSAVVAELQSERRRDADITSTIKEEAAGVKTELDRARKNSEDSKRKIIFVETELSTTVIAKEAIQTLLDSKTREFEELCSEVVGIRKDLDIKAAAVRDYEARATDLSVRLEQAERESKRHLESDTRRAGLLKSIGEALAKLIVNFKLRDLRVETEAEWDLERVDNVINQVLAALQKRSTALTASNKNRIADLERKAKTASALDNKLANLEAQLANALSIVEEAKNRAASEVRKAFDEKMSSLCASQRLVEKAAKSIGVSFPESMLALESSPETLGERLGRFAGALELFERDIGSRRQALVETRDQVVQLQKTIEALEDERKDLKQASSGLERLLKEREEELAQRNTAEGEKQERSNAKEQKEKGKVQSELTEVRRARDALEGHAIELRRQLCAKEALNAEIRRREQTIQDAKEKLEKKNKVVEEERKELKERCKKAEDLLAKVTQEKENADEELRKHIDECVRQAQELKRLKASKSLVESMDDLSSPVEAKEQLRSGGSRRHPLLSERHDSLLMESSSELSPTSRTGKGLRVLPKSQRLLAVGKSRLARATMGSRGSDKSDITDKA